MGDILLKKNFGNICSNAISYNAIFLSIKMQCCRLQKKKFMKMNTIQR